MMSSRRSLPLRWGHAGSCRPGRGPPDHPGRPARGAHSSTRDRAPRNVRRLRRADGGGRTSTTPTSSLTDIRMPPTGTRRGRPRDDELRRLAPPPASWCSASTTTPSSRWPCSRRRQGRAYLLKERMSDPSRVGPPLLEVAAGIGHRPQGGRRPGPRAQLRAASSPLAALTAASARCSREMAAGKDNTAIAGALFLDRARGGEEHQQHLHQARSGGRGGDPQAGQGRAGPPRLGLSPAPRGCWHHPQ